MLVNVVVWVGKHDFIKADSNTNTNMTIHSIKNKNNTEIIVYVKPD